MAHVTTIDATLRVLLLHQLTAIRDAGFEVAGVSAPGPWTGDLERAGIRHYAVPSLSRRRAPLADLRALIDLVRLFRRERFTIVHAHMPKTGVLGRVAARLAGVPIVVNTVHGVYGTEQDHGLRRWFFLTLERLAARVSDFELCQGGELFHTLTHLGILNPDRSRHLGNGIDLSYFDPEAADPAAVAALRDSLQIPPGAPVVGTVGRMTWEKGYREFFAANERVRAAEPGVVFVACGPADDRDDLSSDVLARARAHGVRFLGYRSDMRDVYALMDVFVLATHREGFPRSAMEAAAMGKAVILTDISGCRNVVRHERDGLLVPARAVDPLADAILRLLRDGALRERLGAAARRRARADFDERRVFTRVIDVYQHLLATRREELTVHGSLGSQSTAQR